MKKNIRELQRKIDDLRHVKNHPRVIEAIEKVMEERQPEIEYLEKQIKELRLKVPNKKPRFPENVPQKVLDICKEYWLGTTEYNTFRIHVWNDKAVWTSYPSGGYSNNMGWNPTPAHFYLISLSEKEDSMGYTRAKCYLDVAGRNSEKKLLQLLEENTK